MFQLYFYSLLVAVNVIQLLQLLKNLRFNSHGKEITDMDILELANSKVRTSGCQSYMASFKDKRLLDGIFFLELLSEVYPRTVNWSLVTKGETGSESSFEKLHGVSNINYTSDAWHINKLAY